MFKKLLAVLTFAVASVLSSQQPQTNDIPPSQPIFATNAKYVNGVAPGYWPQALSTTGLTLNIGPGTSFFGSIITYSGGNVTMSNGTNYVYLDETTGIPSVSASPFSSGQFPIAIVVANGGNITSVVDVRTMFFAGSGAGSGCTVTGTANYFVFWNGTACVTSTIDEGVTQGNTTTIIDQDITLEAQQEVDVQAGGEDGIWLCTSVGGGSNCPATGSGVGGLITIEAGIGVNVTAENGAINLITSSGGGAINIIANTSVNVSSSAGGHWDDVSADGIILSESAEVSGSIELDNTGTGNIQFNSAGGIEIDDNNSAGIQIDESATGAPIALGADEIDLFGGTVGTVIFGPLKLSQVLFSTLNGSFPCNSGNAGKHATVSDSTTSTWGDTITGTGTPALPVVSAFCDGTAWTVEGK